MGISKILSLNTYKGKFNQKNIDILIMKLYLKIPKTTYYQPSDEIKLIISHNINEIGKFRVDNRLKSHHINVNKGNAWHSVDNKLVDSESLSINSESHVSDLRHKSTSNVPKFVYRQTADKSLTQNNFLSSYSNKQKKNKWIMSNNIIASYEELYGNKDRGVDINCKTSLA
jgi:hypothetical protein